MERGEIKYIDLFCGIGSFHYSFKKLGMKCVLACDINEDSRNTYKLNYGIEPLGDIKNIDVKKIEKFDILTAGWPCQSFSICGKHAGLNDDRGNLFYYIIEIAKYHTPPIILLENVPQLLKHNNGCTFNTIKQEFELLGYNVIYSILKCEDYGIPQMRKRLFILCTHTDINTDTFFNLDKYKHHVLLKDFLGKDFIKDTAYTIRCGGKKSPINDKHNWDGYFVNGKEYRLTIDDALKLQGFENFILTGSNTSRWKQVGNTIPTIFTYMLGEKLKIIIDETYRF